MRRAALLLAVLLLVTAVPCGAAWAGSGDEDPKADPKAEADPKTKKGGGKQPPPAPKQADEPAGPPRAGSLRDIGRALGRLALRVAKIIEDANRDPDEAIVDIYVAYAPKELKNRRRQVRAKHIVAIMVDPRNALPLRERAKKVVAEGTWRGDIELSATSKRRGMQERALFCKNEVVDHLKDDDREARRLTHELLMEWYRVRTVSAILTYKYDDKKTWSRAITAWIKELKRQ